MERVGNKRIEDFPATTLYLDDLEEIVGILAGACERLEIRVGDYKITDARELSLLAQKFRDRFEHIALQGYDPYVSVDLRTYGVSAYISEDSLEQRGIVARIGDVINKGKKKNPGWFYGALTNVLALAGTITALNKEYALGLTMVAASFLSIPFAVKYGMKNKVIVHTVKRGQVTSFFERRKDDLGLAAISAILGGVVTYLITRYLP